MDGEKALRERLVDVGVELVLEGGTSPVGLREIARRAGVSHGAPRRYFPTHRALLSAVARRGFEELGARSAHAVAGADGPRAELAALARAYLAYARERRGMFELMFRHELLDGGGREAAPDGPRCARPPCRCCGTSPSWSPGAGARRRVPRRPSPRPPSGPACTASPSSGPGAACH